MRRIQDGHLEVVWELVHAGEEELLLKTLVDGTSCLCIVSTELVRELNAAERAWRLLGLTEAAGRSSLAAARSKGHDEVAASLDKAGGRAVLHMADARGATCLLCASAHAGLMHALAHAVEPALVRKLLPGG